MLADVPVGAFLSGGIDSSIVAAMMQENSTKPIDTFSLGFQEQRFDEAPFARAIARHLGTNHSEMYLTDREAAQIAPKLSTVYSEPFADGSQIPTLAISQVARRDVTAVLTGEGGDELFGGYTRYLEAPKIWKIVSTLPLPGRNLLAKAVSMGGSKYPGRIKSKLISLARLASAVSESELHDTFVSVYDPTDVLIYPAQTDHKFGSKWQHDVDFASKMMVTDMETYLVDDLLVKVDRAGMAFGLETRMPFLDISVANFASSLPVSLKIKNRETKWILRRVLDGYAPRQLFDRPKKGFSAPIEMWLRSPAFADWVESNLASSQLLKFGFFDAEIVQRMLSDHLAGTRNWQAVLWNIAVFQDWFATRRG
jgi:asparagine synthase (glutamine-hydrolysing)